MVKFQDGCGAACHGSVWCHVLLLYSEGESYAVAVQLESTFLISSLFSTQTLRMKYISRSIWILNTLNILTSCYSPRGVPLWDSVLHTVTQPKPENVSGTFSHHAMCLHLLYLLLVGRMLFWPVCCQNTSSYITAYSGYFYFKHGKLWEAAMEVCPRALFCFLFYTFVRSLMAFLSQINSTKHFWFWHYHNNHNNHFFKNGGKHFRLNIVIFLVLFSSS